VQIFKDGENEHHTKGPRRPVAPWGQGLWGLPTGPSGHGLMGRAHPTIPPRSRVAGWHWGVSRHQTPLWGWEQAKAGQGCGPAGGPH